MNPTNKEVLKGSPDEKITIKSVEEFRKKLNISELPEGELKNFFEKPLETTQGELDDLRKAYLNNEPNLKTVKKFLESARLSVIEEAKDGVNKVKQITSDIQSSIKIEKLKNIDGAKSAETAEKTMDELLNKTNNIKGEVGEAVTESVKKAKEVGAKVIEGGYTVQLGEAMNDAFNKFKKFDIIGAILSLFKGLFGMFVGNEAIKKIGDKAKEAIKNTLSNEQIDITKNNIKTTLLKTFPDKEEYIDKILKNPRILTDGKLEKFYNKIKSGETITLNDLTKDFSELGINELLTEKANEYKEKIYSSIRSDIEKKYNKTLDTEQVKDLGKLIATHLTVNKANVEALQSKITNEQQLQLKDIMPIFFEGGKNSMGFMFGLVSANIISVSDIAMNFAAKGGEIINISLSALGLSENISIDNLYESISGMEEKDKAILIGLLYRKGGLFLSILGNLTAVTSKILIETILPTNSGVDGVKLGYDALINGNSKQIENFQKIEDALSSSKTSSIGKEFLDESVRNLNKVKNNFTVLEILKQSNGDVETFYKKISDFEKANNIKFTKFDDFKQLSNSVSEFIGSNFASSFDKGSVRGLKNSIIGFGANDAIQEFNRNLENITKNQSRIAKGVLNLNPLKKLTDAIDISKVSKLGDSLVFELRSKDDAKAFLKQANELAKKSPDLIKGIFDKLPIIAVTGLAASGEEPFFDNLANEMPYLLPVVGPIMMISDAGVNWKTFPPTFMKAEQAAIAGALLTIDGFFLYKAGLKGALPYMAKPLKDMYDMGKGTVEIGQRLYKTGKVLENGKTIKSVFGTALEKTKNLKGKFKAIAIIGLIGVGAVELALADDEVEEFNKYIKDGRLDYESVKKDSELLTNTEKLELTKIILLENSGSEVFEDINYELKNNKILAITSYNRKYKSEFFINNETKEILNDLFGIDEYKLTFKEKTV